MLEAAMARRRIGQDQFALDRIAVRGSTSLDAVAAMMDCGVAPIKPDRRLGLLTRR
jgi:hypothetical protein